MIFFLYTGTSTLIIIIPTSRGRRNIVQLFTTCLHDQPNSPTEGIRQNSQQAAEDLEWPALPTTKWEYKDKYKDKMERQSPSCAKLRVSRITSPVPLNPLQHCLDPPSFASFPFLLTTSTETMSPSSSSSSTSSTSSSLSPPPHRLWEERGGRGGGTKSQVIWSVCCFFKNLQREPQQGERSCRFSCAHNPTWKYFTPRAQIQLDKWSKSENLKNLRPNSTATTNAMVPLSWLC